MTLDDAGLALLLDPDRLTDLTGHPVRATHLRPKLGRSAVAALVEPDGRPWGWIRTLTGQSRDKAGKARQFAVEIGRPDEIIEAEIPGRDTVVQCGPLSTDPRLARELTRVSRLLPDTAVPGQVLRYNPLRRLVLRHRDVVLRSTEQIHHDRAHELTEGLAQAGVPVAVPLANHPASGPKTTVWPWIAGSDAAGTTDPNLMFRIGSALGQLHATATPLRIELPDVGWAQLRAAAERSVALLAEVSPDVAEAARRALATLPVQVPTAGTRPVLLHGDFSLDQCLVEVDPEGPTVLLSDLDRAARGPAAVDHACLLAAALAAQDPALTRDGDGPAAYAEGYGSAAGTRPAAHGAWVAAALLSRVAEPWRTQQPGWRAETLRRSLLAARLAGEPDAAEAIRSMVDSGRAADRPLPATLSGSGEQISVDRAWPGRDRDGAGATVVEGRDHRGRIRAATVAGDGSIRILPYGQDRRLPGLPAAVAGGELLVHRAGRRAVVRQTDGYVKVLRPGRAAAVAEAAERGADLARAAGLATPHVLGVDDSSVRFSVLPGRAVHDLADSPGWGEVWQQWSRAWVAWQGLGEDPAARGLPAWTGAEEAGMLQSWLARATDQRLLAGHWVERGRQVADRLRGDPTARLVPTHRDLHDKQLLWDGRRLGVLDLDTVCLADAALDPANLAVHSELRAVQRLWTPSAAATAVAAAETVATAAGVEPSRWQTASLATLLRLVAVYSFRPRWRQLVADWAEQSWAQRANALDLSPISPNPGAAS